MSFLAKVVLIGTGGGYGECILIQFSPVGWIVIDSCINPSSKTSLPLEYLRSTGVNLDSDIKLILCTHWHDDHIRGMDELFEACTSAKLCFAPCTDKRKFLQWVGLDSAKSKFKTSNSSTKVFNNCLALCQQRGGQIIRASQDRQLFHDAASNFSVHALSPTDKTMESYDAEISQLITEYGHPSKEFVPNSPNNKSVALLIKLNQHTVLLGADLEVSSDDLQGWKGVYNMSSTLPHDKNVSLYKVPHHGSENAFFPQIWDTVLANDCIQKLTPWVRAKSIPTTESLKVLLSKSPRLYITSARHLKAVGKPKKRPSKINKSILRFIPNIQEIAFDYGRIECAIDPTDPSGQWQITLAGSAEQVSI